MRLVADNRGIPSDLSAMQEHVAGLGSGIVLCPCPFDDAEWKLEELAEYVNRYDLTVVGSLGETFYVIRNNQVIPATRHRTSEALGSRIGDKVTELAESPDFRERDQLYELSYDPSKTARAVLRMGYDATVPYEGEGKADLLLVMDRAFVPIGCDGDPEGGILDEARLEELLRIHGPKLHPNALIAQADLVVGAVKGPIRADGRANNCAIYSLRGREIVAAGTIPTAYQFKPRTSPS